MSDTSRIDKITSSAKNNKNHYTDFYTNLNKHPETGYLITLSDADSVKRSIRNLILTNRGEAVFQPNKGSDVRKSLFEPMNDITADIIKTYINETIDQYEPRCEINEIIVTPDYSNNAYVVYIVFQVINNITPIVLNLLLSRTR